MRLTRSNFRKRVDRQAEPAILFTVSSSIFAIAASAVEEIRNIEGLVPCAMGDTYKGLRKVKFFLERNQRKYLVIDSNLHFHATPSQATRLLVLRNAPLAVLVDNIDRMCALSVVRKLPQAFTGEERHWYRGLTVLNDRVIPLVNPQAFLSQAETAVALSELLRAGVAREEDKNVLAKGAATA